MNTQFEEEISDNLNNNAPFVSDDCGDTMWDDVLNEGV
jgi:hypothetical protein